MIFLSSFFEKHVLNIFDTFINNQKVTGKFFNTSNWYVFIVKYHTVILKILTSNMKQIYNKSTIMAYNNITRYNC